MKRNPRKLKWTKSYRKAAGKEMTVVRTKDKTQYVFSLSLSNVVRPSGRTAAAGAAARPRRIFFFCAFVRMVHKLIYSRSFRNVRQDATFEFEKRRNRPEKYDRNVMASTLKAMKTVQRIQKAREDRFYMNRMKDNKSREKERIKMDIEQNIDLVAPAKSKARAKIEETIIAKQKEREARKKSAEATSAAAPDAEEEDMDDV